MNVRQGLAVGLKTIVLAIALTVIFMLGAMVSGMARAVPSPSGTTTATQAAAQGQNMLLLLFVASLVQAIVVTYVVLEAKWGGWKLTGALSLVIVNVWAQSAIESVPYLQNRLGPHYSSRALVMGLVIAILFAPLAVWVLGGFRRAPTGAPGERVHWSAARWIGTLIATTVAFVVLYYLCGYYIAWQNPALREFYSGTTAIRSFSGQIASIWSSMPWMFAFQAGRGLLFVALTLPAVRMLRGGAPRVALGTALMYAAWDGSPGLIIPNPIFAPTVAHSHMIELAIWGLLFGAFVGWLVGRGNPRAHPDSQLA